MLVEFLRRFARENGLEFRWMYLPDGQYRLEFRNPKTSELTYHVVNHKQMVDGTVEDASAITRYVENHLLKENA